MPIGFLDLLPGGKYRTNIYITERTEETACALHTRIMKRLLDMDVLKLPTQEQAKGLCTVLFLGDRLK